jgi:hypothetical protein
MEEDDFETDAEQEDDIPDDDFVPDEVPDKASGEAAPKQAE